MTGLLLTDALDYITGLTARMKKSGKATENDITMTEYIAQILEDRIAAKRIERERQGKNNDAACVSGGV